MLTITARRLLAALPLLLAISVAAFLLTTILPGDPARAIAGEGATIEQVEQVRDQLHLDDPAPVRYLRWLGGVLTGDFGVSAQTGVDISSELLHRLPITGSIALAALLVGVLVGTAIGVAQGAFAGRLPDRVLLVFVSLGLATPAFWLGTLLVALLAVRLGWLPSIGYVPFAESPLGWLEHAILPVLTLAAFIWSEVARQLRSGLVDVMDKDYVRAARARGLHPTRVVGQHALRNAAMPTLTILGVRLGFLLAGSILIEQIFQIPGLGSYAFQAIQNRDVAVIQAIVVVSAVIVLVASLVVDLLYTALDPKLRVS